MTRKTKLALANLLILILLIVVTQPFWGVFQLIFITTSRISDEHADEIVRSITRWEDLTHPPRYKLLHAEKRGSFHGTIYVEISTDPETMDSMKTSVLQSFERRTWSGPAPLPPDLHPKKPEFLPRWWKMADIPDVELVEISRPWSKGLIMSKKTGRMLLIYGSG